MREQKKIDLCMVFIGRPGSGKTTKARSVVRTLSPVRPVLVHDPLREWEGRPTSSTPKSPGVYVDRRDDADGILERLYTERKAVLDRGGQQQELILVIDEGAAWGGERRHSPPPHVKKLLQGRRHLGLGFIVLVQYASLAPLDLWNSATHAVVFRTNPGDLDGLRKRGLPPELASAACGFTPGIHQLHAF